MPAPKKPHVLLIEDDSFFAHIYKTKFEMEGFKVSISENGEAGLADARKKKPQVILLDVLLPKKDGFTVLSEMKADKRVSHIPVILLTNLGQKEDVARGMALGAEGYLIKAHFKPAEVVNHVKSALAHAYYI